MRYYKKIELACKYCNYDPFQCVEKKYFLPVKGKHEEKYFILYKNNFFRNYVTCNGKSKEFSIRFMRLKS